MVRRSLRSALFGAVAAGIALSVLYLAGSRLPFPLVDLILLAALYSAIVSSHRRSLIECAMVGGTLGIPIWAVSLPLIGGRGMALDAETMRSNFMFLIAWVLFGIVFGTLLELLQRLAHIILGNDEESFADTTPAGKRIVVLGGGFAGMGTAEHLEALLKSTPSASITLVSETNALLFTPMLAEVAGGSLEPTHISTPIRSGLQRTEFIRARVAGVDPTNHQITLEERESPDGSPRAASLPYDYLVIAVGSVPNFLGMDNVQKLALNFRSLIDASHIRNRVIEKFELADKQPIRRERQKMLRFVIAGGGYAGVELAGAMNDLARGILINYPNIQPDEVEVMLVHSRDRILPELTETLAVYALKRMEERGVVFRLNTRVKDATPSTVVLGDGTVEAQTLIWTAGSAPNDLLKSLPFATDKRGALLVEPTLTVLDQDDVWALGDCAAASDSLSGLPCPPTAQFAIREAKTVAKNVCLKMKGLQQSPFHFRSLGSLCVVGHQTACAELALPFGSSKSIKFSGLAAWLMWRLIYLSKLPGSERKVRVLLDWVLELFFPRDIVQTHDIREARP